MFLAGFLKSPHHVDDVLGTSKDTNKIKVLVLEIIEGHVRLVFENRLDVKKGEYGISFSRKVGGQVPAGVQEKECKT